MGTETIHHTWSGIDGRWCRHSAIDIDTVGAGTVLATARGAAQPLRSLLLQRLLLVLLLDRVIDDVEILRASLDRRQLRLAQRPLVGDHHGQIDVNVNVVRNIFVVGNN